MITRGQPIGGDSEVFGDCSKSASVQEVLLFQQTHLVIREWYN